MRIKHFLAGLVMMAVIGSLAGCGSASGGDDSSIGGGTVGGGGSGSGGFRSIGPNASINGALSSGDITLWDGTHADGYYVTLTRSGTLTVSMTATEIDSYLFLYSDDVIGVDDIDLWCDYLIVSNDDSGCGRDALITSALAPGKYVIVAKSYAFAYGSYELTTSFN